MAELRRFAPHTALDCALLLLEADVHHGSCARDEVSLVLLLLDF